MQKAELLPGTLSEWECRVPACSRWSWAHGSQLPRSVLSRERLLVFWGETGLGGLLRLELLEAVECLGESESYKNKALVRSKGTTEDSRCPRPLQYHNPTTRGFLSSVSRQPLYEMIGGCTHMKTAEPFH